MSSPDPATPAPVELPLLYRSAGRIRGLTWPSGPILLIVGCAVVTLAQIADFPSTIGVAVAVVGVLLLGVWSACALFPGGPNLPVAALSSPVDGRWRALNSPTTKKPSHGTHTLGQTFALDLLHEPTDRTKPEFPTSTSFLPPSHFPAFGAPVRAPAAGSVIAVHDGSRDHRSRTSWLAFGYLMIEGMVREFLGTRTMLGNHVVIKTPAGYVMLAHLRRGSVQVAPGDSLRAGQQVAECGNTGNSSEPHVHMQLTDTPRLPFGCGIPFRLEGTRDDDGVPLTDLPASGEVLIAG